MLKTAASAMGLNMLSVFKLYNGRKAPLGYFMENNRIPEISLAGIHRDLNYYQLILTNLCIGKVKK